MIKINRKGPSDSKEENMTGSEFIKFMKVQKRTKRIIKFKSVLDNKNCISLIKKGSSDIIDFNHNRKNEDFLEIKSTYNYIIKQIDSLMNKLNKNNYEDIYSLLMKIKNFINKIISDQILIKRDISHRSDMKQDKEDKYTNYNNCKYSFDKRFILSKEQDNDSFNKMNSYINETSSRFFKINNNSKRVKILEQRNIDLEDKLKTEKLKYLFCIGEQHKKIKELEKELNQKNVENMTQIELKQYKCFPYYKKFNFLDNQHTKTRNKLLNQKVHNNKRHKKYVLEQYNNLNKSEKEDDLIQNTEEIIEYGEKIVKKKELEGNKILDKQGNYFISHPKLKYIKDDLNMKAWKTNELIDSLPKELLRHKFTSKSQKNHLIVFPSSLNQIMVNLEKLRIHNNFQRIENEFKENNRIINK